MAITIRQEPTSPNVANSNLVFVATSNSSSEAQFQYVVDIKDVNNNLIQRVKQQPNPSGKGVFDFGNIIPTQLGPVDRVWDIANVSANETCGADFKIYFGEEYGTSPSSSITEVTPNTTGSSYYFLTDGFVNESAELNFNWNSGSKYNEESTDGSTTFNHQFGLTSFNTSSVRLGDYHTISILNGNLAGVANGDLDNTLAQDIYAVVYRQYDANDTLLDTDILYNTAAGPRTSNTEIWDDVYLNQNQTTRLIHFPAGPQNIEDAGVPILSDDTGYYTMTFYNQTLEPGVNYNGVWGEYRFEIDNTACDFPGVRFAWKNQWGVWDYFNFNLAETTTSNIERQEYKQSFVNFSTTSNTVTYDRERRGRNNYYNDVTKIRTANTDFLNQTNADNLREMFYSTDVYVQRSNGEWWPVVLLDASVTEKTNPRSQKLFRYAVTYSYANEQRPRL